VKCTSADGGAARKKVLFELRDRGRGVALRFGTAMGHQTVPKALGTDQLPKMLKDNVKKLSSRKESGGRVPFKKA